MKPLDYFEGGDKTVKGLPKASIITMQMAQVMDDKFRVIATVMPNTLLGTLIMSLDTGKGVFHRFKTIDNTERWVKAQLTKRYDA
jgi:hypothetical protein